MRIYQAAALMLIGTIFCAAAIPADAKRYKKQRFNRIKVQSLFDVNSNVVVPVRRSARGGSEVRLPGGSWIHCQGNCEWTVQKEYLDQIRYQQIPFGPGYIRFNVR